MNLMKKLLLGFFSIILLLGIATGVTYYEFGKIDDEYGYVIEDSSAKIRYATYAIFETYKQQVALQTYINSGSEVELDNYLAARDEFEKNIEIIRGMSDQNEELEIIDRMVKAEEQYYQTVERMLSYRNQNNRESFVRVMEEDGDVIDQVYIAARELFFLQQDNLEHSSNELSEHVSDTVQFILIISLLAIVIGVAVAIFLSKHISKNVRLVSASAEQIASGNLAIEEINMKSKDEIGQLAQSFNKMTENLRGIIERVSQTSEQVAASSEELLASAEENKAATNQVATSITEVATSVDVQGTNTEESARGVGEITTGIVRIADNASMVAESSTETMKQASLGNEYIQRVVQQMDTISKASLETNQVVQELEKRSAEIGKIIEVITDIADQTNLLALNAAIESARAGEHGKGFSVVAEEVRKLAEQSRESAKQISDIVTFIQADTSRAVEMMNHGKDEVANGLDLVEETGKTFGVIVNSISTSNAQVQELSAISEQISASVEEVNAAIEEVSELARSSSDHAREISAVTEEQLASTEEVTASATSLANMAEELRELVSRFKV